MDKKAEQEPAIADVPEEVPIVHCMPVQDIIPHIEAHTCWCSPQLNARYPETGGEVWLHRMAQECYH
jgi:hypothetical protein